MIYRSYTIPLETPLVEIPDTFMKYLSFLYGRLRNSLYMCSENNVFEGSAEPFTQRIPAKLPGNAISVTETKKYWCGFWSLSAHTVFPCINFEDITKQGDR